MMTVSKDLPVFKVFTRADLVSITRLYMKEMNTDTNPQFLHPLLPLNVQVISGIIFQMSQGQKIGLKDERLLAEGYISTPRSVKDERLLAEGYISTPRSVKDEHIHG